MNENVADKLNYNYVDTLAPALGQRALERAGMPKHLFHKQQVSDAKYQSKDAKNVLNFAEANQLSGSKKH